MARKNVKRFKILWCSLHLQQDDTCIKFRLAVHRRHVYCRRGHKLLRGTRRKRVASTIPRMMHFKHIKKNIVTCTVDRHLVYDVLAEYITFSYLADLHLRLAIIENNMKSRRLRCIYVGLFVMFLIADRLVWANRDESPMIILDDPESWKWHSAG